MPPPVALNPAEMSLAGEPFDPRIHLQIEPPAYIKDLNFRNVPFPFSAEEKKVRGNLAYTTSFRVLSDAGIAAARRSIAANEHLAKGNGRATKFIRGLGYTSKFHRGLAYSAELNSVLSALARDTVAPHTLSMNISHTNVGEVGTGKPVDKWHTDSVDYVMVLILSDMTDMVGGELKVLQMPDASGHTFKQLTLKGVPEELVEVAKYGGAGYCILMQGTKILHAVTQVLQAREPRLSVVNSYMTLRPFNPDRFRYNTFKEGGFNDPQDVLALEFARHKAWRIGGKMRYVLEEVRFGASATDLAALLQEAQQELALAVDLLRGRHDDSASWVEEKVVAPAGAGRARLGRMISRI
ncbi:hypothetical protein B484DRAFT_399713 [Ochromonadaceae sp. CCMP2298]|nr:hypothetical protein B484DRAFT_399713 [Ochromonadaceae sp. CCMP2298]